MTTMPQETTTTRGDAEIVQGALAMIPGITCRGVDGALDLLGEDPVENYLDPVEEPVEACW